MNESSVTTMTGLKGPHNDETNASAIVLSKKGQDCRQLMQWDSGLMSNSRISPAKLCPTLNQPRNIRSRPENSLKLVLHKLSRLILKLRLIVFAKKVRLRRQAAEEECMVGTYVKHSEICLGDN